MKKILTLIFVLTALFSFSIPAFAAVADTGELEIIKKAEATGNALAGSVFGVYDADTDMKLETLTTDENGEATLSIAVGEYYLLEEVAPQGYLKETAKILFTVYTDRTTIIEVTNMRDENAMPYIQLPATGEAFPFVEYALSAVLFAVAIGCIKLLCKRYINIKLLKN